MLSSKLDFIKTELVFFSNLSSLLSIYIFTLFQNQSLFIFSYLIEVLIYFPFVSILELTVFLSDSSSQPSSSVSNDTLPSSPSFLPTPQQPPLNPIPITPSLYTTPVNTQFHTPFKTSIPQQTQNSLTLPLSDTDSPFIITPTHSPPPSSFHIPDPSDINPILLRNIHNPTLPKPKLIPTSIKSFRRRSQLDNFLSIPPPCSHISSQPSLPPPKPLKIPALESLESLQKKSDLSEIDSTTCSLLYPRLPPSNSVSKYTTSSLDNLLDTTSESILHHPLRHRYNLHNNRRPSPFLASTNSSLLRHHAQSLSSDSLSLTRKTLHFRELTLLFLNVLLFLLIITLVTFSLVPPLKIPLFFHLIVIYVTLILLLINTLLLLNLIVLITI